MVQVVSNRTEIEGTVVSRSAHPTLKDFDLLELQLKRAAPVPGFADLISPNFEPKIEVAVRRDLLPSGTVEGAHIHGRAWVAGPGALFAEPLPESATPFVTN
jgi:hypothetical protein